MKRQIPTPVAAAVLVAAILAVIWMLGSATPTEGNQALVGAPVPALVGETTTGETFRASDHKGRVLLVNFWATWCGPCKMEIPHLIELQKKYGPRGLQVVGLSIDREGMAVVRPFAEKQGFNYPILMAPEGAQKAFGGVEAIPASFLIDKNGKVVHSVEGLVTQDQLAPKIEELL